VRVHYKKTSILPRSFSHVYGHTVHVAKRWPSVLRVLDPGVANCTFGRMYSNTRVQLDTCVVIHVADCFLFFNYIFYLNIII
jgi:hypothetical protein